MNKLLIQGLIDEGFEYVEVTISPIGNFFSKNIRIRKGDTLYDGIFLENVLEKVNKSKIIKLKDLLNIK